uniref:TF-B3 domain-containing protein n=1 Tax=Aegilops tauschii subsp. strangulata TaxID=200361 RepID=A0A452XWA8_AEGTS
MHMNLQTSYSVLGFYATAFDRALEVEKKLPAEGPSFVKLMQISHVVRVFWLGVPVSFCREHLPNHDVTIVLEDEDGHRFDTNYLARKQGLSGGWNRFATRHHLKVGDAVVFQLVEPTRFKASASSMFYSIIFFVYASFFYFRKGGCTPASASGRCIRPLY